MTLERTGKAFLGGLGGMASERSGVWACLRGWDDTEQRRCGKLRGCLCSVSISGVRWVPFGETVVRSKRWCARAAALHRTRMVVGSVCHIMVADDETAAGCLVQGSRPLS